MFPFPFPKGASVRALPKLSAIAAGVAVAISAAPAVVPTEAVATHDRTAPTAISKLTAVPGDRRASLAWTASRDNVRVTRYRVWRKTGSTGTWVSIANPTTPRYVDTSVVNGRTYSYGVYAYDAAGNRSAAAKTVTVKPAAPTRTVTTAPAPAPAPTGSLGTTFWRADAENTIDREWASYATPQHCSNTTAPGMTDTRVRRDTSIRAKGTASYRLEVRDNDICYGNERTEIAQGNPTRSDMLDRLFKDGQDRWMSWQMRLGEGFPVNTGGWYDVIQWKQMGALGSPAIALEVQDGQWDVTTTGSDPSRQVWGRSSLGPAKAGTWVKFTAHIKFSPSSSVGFIHFFGDLGDGRGMRELLPLKKIATMKVDGGRTIDSHLRIGLYRDKAISGTHFAHYDGWTIASTRAAAEAGAF